MDFGEYQKASYTAIQEHRDRKEEEMHWALGIGEEAGEVLGVIKHRHYSGEFGVDKLMEELGDVMWHVAAICTVFGIDMADVAEYNLAKLRHRYPGGVFDQERSSNRHAISIEFDGSEFARQLAHKYQQKCSAAHAEE